MSKDQQAQLRRVLEEQISRQAIKSPKRLAATLEDSLYFERQRLKTAREGPQRELDSAFFESLARDMAGASEHEQAHLLRRVVNHYSQEIAGNFDPRVYQMVTRALPPALGLLLNAVSPSRLMSGLPSLDASLVLGGETERVKSLIQRGTVVLVPSHQSHIDAIVAGYALFQLGLPHFVYGAALNLFSNPIIRFFMHNLGAYTIDREKQDPLYKACLVRYAALTISQGKHSFFFPAGQRSRSGAVEKKLKRGLLGACLSAYTDNIIGAKPSPKVFMVPVTVSYELLLEAESLIEDFLKPKGQRRLIIEDDAFSKPVRAFDYLSKLVRMDARFHVRFGQPTDVFGLPVDSEGQSRDPQDRIVDPRRYLFVHGQPKADALRDAEYTRELEQGLLQSYRVETVVHATHVVARAAFQELLSRGYSPLRLLRTETDPAPIPKATLLARIDQLTEELKALKEAYQIQLADELYGPAEAILQRALSFMSCFHERPVLRREGEAFIASHRQLLFFYQNRLDHTPVQGQRLLSKNGSELVKEAH